MTPREQSPLLRLWWAGPTVVAVSAGLAFVVGFAPRLADRVSLPREVAVAPATAGAHPAPKHAGVTRPKPHRPHVRPTVTPTPVVSRPVGGGNTSGGTVVAPARPVVTSGTPEDDNWSSSATPTPRESETAREGGDG